MRPFIYDRARQPPRPRRRLAAVPADAHVRAPVQFLAGGTTLLDLMKLDVMRPERLVDINALADTAAGRDRRRRARACGSARWSRMADAADHPAVQRDYPVIAQALQLAASQQLRNMASLGGNVLQRTRCNYFRDTSWPPATSASRARAARRSAASTGSTPCWAPATSASRPIPATSPRR